MNVLGMSLEGIATYGAILCLWCASMATCGSCFLLHGKAIINSLSLAALLKVVIVIVVIVGTCIRM